MRIKQKARILLAGDMVERAAKPVAVVFRMKCLDSEKRLIPSSPCGKRKAALNRWDNRLRKWMLDNFRRLINTLRKR